MKLGWLGIFFYCYFIHSLIIFFRFPPLLWAFWARINDDGSIEDNTNNVVESLHAVIKKELEFAVQGK